MVYNINKSDGQPLVDLIDGTLDDTTSLTLIGKNYSGFGEVFNENLVKLLENFANSSPPERAIPGQLWYDTSEGRLKVYTINGWKASGGPVVSDTQPLTLTTGDLWIDNVENQMWMYDGTDLILVGPIWKKSQGKTGLVAETISDTNGNSKSILKLYVGDFLLGIFSSENFTPAIPIDGFEKTVLITTTAPASTTNTLSVVLNPLSVLPISTIQPGFIVSGVNIPANTVVVSITGNVLVISNNVTLASGSQITVTSNSSLVRGFNTNSQVSFVFDTIATKAEALVDNLKNPIKHSQFLRSDQNATTSGKLLIQNNLGLTIGANQNADFKITGNTLIIENVIADGDIAIRTKNVTSNNTPIYIDASTNCVGIFTTTPQLLLNSLSQPTQTLDVDGILRVRGDLIVDGDTTTLNVTNLSVEDKNIEIAKTSTPSDTYANGAGITIKGDSDKSITWTQATGAFDITENINLSSGKVLRINNVEVLSLTALGPSITSAPGITSFGPQTQLTVDDLYFNDNRISSTISNMDIELDPSGTGNVALIGNPKITGLATPTASTDAANKAYVDVTAAAQPISVTIVENGLQNALDGNIILILNDIANPVYFADGKIAFVHCQFIDYDSTAITATRTLKRFEIQGGAWTFVSNLPSSV